MRSMFLIACAVLLTGAPLMAENRIDLIRPDAPALAPFGPLPIGATTLDLFNPDQIDIVNATETAAPLYDRPVNVEIWYPAADGTVPGGTYSALIRDGVTRVTLTGRAARDATPREGTRYPLVILSHGYPGNRFLMSPLAENLASKGYVVASIDHAESTYDSQLAFGSTLVNRPWDQRFVLDSLALLQGDLGAIIDTNQTAVIGYSMGGYGALIFAGAGVTTAAPGFSYAAPQRLLERNMVGTDSLTSLVDDRVRAVVAFGPWGRNADFWDAEGLSAIERPLMIIAGSVDDVSGYSAIRQIFAETTGTTRHLLTFVNANHNAGAPMPSPAEGWAVSDTLGWASFDHYADPVWDSVRMNNISQHFITAFLGIHLKGEVNKAPYLDLVPRPSDGVLIVDDAGNPIAGNTYWMGFAPRTAVGLEFETLDLGE